MNATIVEIKAKSNDHESLRSILESKNAKYIGEDHQVDTYFNVPKGRLKLREGSIEKTLIGYDRPNTSEPKNSSVNFLKLDKTEELKQILLTSLGIKVVVDKKRQIYFIDNIKFHLDKVEGLGTFCEIEAIDTEGVFTEAELDKQCKEYMELFNIKKEDLISVSYSDMLLAKN